MIESCFYYTNEDYKTERIQIGESKNEVFIQGQSSTQCAQEYTFPLSHKNNRILRIIDTPGIFYKYFTIQIFSRVLPQFEWVLKNIIRSSS